MSAANWERLLRPSTVHSFPSLAGLLLLAVTLTSARMPCFQLPGPVCFAWDYCYYSASSLARLQSLRGFFTSAAAESGGLFAYGADNFMTTGLFYLMLSPLPDRYSLDHRLLKLELKDPQLLGFWRRVLQVHMCFVYFVGGLAKCLGSGWWNGSNLWRSLTRPPFNLISPDILVRFKYALPILGISICLIELGYPFFIWIKEDPLVLVGLYPGNARGDWTGNGNVPVRARDDRFEPCRLRYRNEQPGTYPFRGYDERRKYRATHGHFRAIGPRHFAAWRLNSTDAKAHVANRLATETLF